MNLAPTVPRFVRRVSRRFVVTVLLMAGWIAPCAWAEVPVEVQVAEAPVGMVVAGHPDATAIGVDVLQAGGNAIDAAVAVSLALGVAEPYGSGLGGKLMLVYFDAATGETWAIDGMDQAPSHFSLEAYRKLSAEQRRAGWTSVCVPGLLAGLALAHQRWGERSWAANVKPAQMLAERGFTILPKSREQFAEQEEKLRADPAMAAVFLPSGHLPEIGSLLPNPDLARTLGHIAVGGAAAFYKGEFARAVVRAAQGAGVDFEADDFAQYEAHLVEPVRAEVWGFEVVGGPPPTTGVSLYLPMLKALEPWSGESPERTADAMNRIGQVWRQVQPEVARRIGDVPGAANAVAEMLSPESIERYRAAAGLEVEMELATTLEPDWTHDAQSTTHFVIVDTVGNAVSVTQSLSLHFGAGVMAPGTGVVMNDTLSNFAYVDESSPNIGAPGKRPRSTTSPTLVLREGRPVLAIGLPGGQRIPTAMFQVLWDHLGGGRSLVDAIGDRRWHLLNPLGDRVGKVWQIEAGLPEAVLQELRAEGWEVEEPEAPGTGHHFGGFTAIEILPDGTRRGLADTRRTNAAAGY